MNSVYAGIENLEQMTKAIRKMNVNAKYYTKNTTILNTILKILLFYTK